VASMSEHDDDQQSTPAEPGPVEPAPAEPAPAEPVAAPKERWRDRTFRMRSIAAVAVAGVILGAAGGAATTALVSGDGHGDRDERFRIGQQMPPGMPMIPPGGRQRFPGMPGDGTEDGELPELPVPPGSEDGSEDGTDDGTDEQSSLSQS
jgi:hypothetical protein